MHSYTKGIRLHNWLEILQALKMYINKQSTLSTITQTGANESLGMSYFSSTAWSTYSRTNNLRFRGCHSKSQVHTGLAAIRPRTRYNNYSDQQEIMCGPERVTDPCKAPHLPANIYKAHTSVLMLHLNAHPCSSICLLEIYPWCKS